MLTPFRCPDCGSPIELDEHAQASRTILRQAPGRSTYEETIMVDAAVAFCVGCEFAVEVGAVPTPTRKGD